MLVSTRGIILRTVKYGETSLIIDIYTQKLGLKSCIISGIRSGKAKTKSGILQIMSLVDIVVYNKKNDSLSRIKEVKAAHYYSHLPFDMIKRSVGLFITEVCAKTIKEKEENIELFRFLEDTFLEIDRTTAPLALYHHIFLVNLSIKLGFGPSQESLENGDYFNLKEGTFGDQKDDLVYTLTKEDSQDLKTLMEYNITRQNKVIIHSKRRTLLLNNLIKYYQFHIDSFGEIKSLAVLQQVLHWDNWYPHGNAN